MNLLFTISAFSASNTGMGGHYHSLLTISEAMARRMPSARIQLASFGDFFPKALEKSALPHRHFHVSMSTFWQASKQVQSFAGSPTHVHAFDRRSFFFARQIADSAQAKLYLTKPGGPTPRYFPFCEDTVVFSEENRLGLAKLKWGSEAPRLHYIPQRVTRVTQDQTRIALLKERFGPGPFLLRICRIGPYYEHSMRQTLALAKTLRANGVPIRALIIGTVEDRDALERIALLKEAEDEVLTDDLFTKSAAQLISIAAAVVGTGRGLMEAAMEGKPVFAPVADAVLPELVTPENVEEIQRTNFSERLVLAKPDPEGGVQALAQALASPARYAQLSQDARLISERFDADVGAAKYADLYEQPQLGRRCAIDAPILWLGALRGLLPS